MINKFKGVSGKQNKLEVLLQNVAVNSDADIAEFIEDNSTLKIFNKDEILIEQESDRNDVFFLLSGDVIAIPKNQKPVTRSAPFTVGEMAALNPKYKRNANVLAVMDNVFVLQMSGQKFQTLCEKHPDFKHRLEKDVSDRMQDRMKSQSNDDEKQEPSFVGKYGWNIGVFIASFFIFLVSMLTFNQISVTAPYSLAISSLVAILAAWLFFWGQPKLVFLKLIKLWLFLGVTRIILDIGFSLLIESSNSKIQIIPENEDETAYYLFYLAVLIILIVAHIFESKKNGDS